MSLVLPDWQRMKLIKTSYWVKPIPLRQFDWSAWFDDLGADTYTAYGATEAEAIQELKELYDENCS